MDKIPESAQENTTSKVSELNMIPVLVAAVLGFIVMG